MPTVTSEWVEELIIRFEKVENSKHDHTYVVNNAIPPLTRHVEYTPFPRKFKMPSLGTYDRTKDPLDHLMTYKSIVKLHNILDEGLCNVFLSTLRRLGLRSVVVLGLKEKVN